MGKFPGGGFGGGNMQQLLKQAQQMQQKIQEAQAELAETEVTGVAGGGLVEIGMMCDKTVNYVTIKPEAIDPDDIEMLEDLIVAATNEALRKVEEESTAVMSKLTGGLGGLGGGLPF